MCNAQLEGKTPQKVLNIGQICMIFELFLLVQTLNCIAAFSEMIKPYSLKDSQAGIPAIGGTVRLLK